MYYTGMRPRGGCASCSAGGNSNLGRSFSPSISINRYRNDYNNNLRYNMPSQNSFELEEDNRRQRFMTPTRNYSSYNSNINNNYTNINRNNIQTYYSPQRNGGCRSCSSNSSNNMNSSNDYQRPLTGNYLRRQNNPYSYNDNNIRSINEDYNFRKRYDNSKFNGYQNSNYNFRNRYEDNKNEDLEENNFKNRYYSPLRNTNPQNLTRSDLKINNYLYNQTNNQYNNENKNNLIHTMLNNQYRNFLEDNINKYRYNNNRNNYYSPKNRNYYSPSSNTKTRYTNSNNNYLNYSNSRYNYLRNGNNDSDRFITANIFSYQREIRELLQKRKTFFLFIYGSHDYTGKSWCSDCNIAMPNVEDGKKLIKNKKFEKEVFFISLPIDKIYMVDLKDDPTIQLERVPTLIYFENGIERNRLVENDLFSYQVVNNFILQAYEQYNLSQSQYLYQPRNYY